MSAYFFLILAMVCSASISIVMKLFPVREGNRYALVLGNYIACIMVGFLMLPDKGAILHPHKITMLLSIIGGAIFVAGFASQQVSIGINGAILTSAFARLGLLVPITVSILCFQERPTLLQGIALILVVAAVIVINGGSAEDATKKLKPLLLIVVLLSVGGAETMSKIFLRVGDSSQDRLFILGIFFFAAIVTTVLLVHESITQGKKVVQKDFFAGMLAGVPNYFASALLLKSLAGLPAILVYPMYSTGVIVVVTLVSAVAFKEQPGRRGWIGLVMILCAVVLLNV
ncbi:MAG: EamA family transporter [Lachnospiraceae bacterium]|nr:EamA family transporter [Lachnospiraceae bacterium]